MTRIEEAVLELHHLLLKRPDRKTKKSVVYGLIRIFIISFHSCLLIRYLTLNILKNLKAKLVEEQDPAMILHLTMTLLVYAVHGGCLMHAPTTATPALICYLTNILPTNVNQRLLAVQSLSSN